jgi:hypothetical protein
MALMTVKATRKLTSVLLDAVIVIEAHALGIWSNLVGKVEILIPSTVVRDEAFYFNSKKKEKRLAIQISKSIKDGEIKEVSATAEDLRSLGGIFDNATLQGLDPGELEALALLKSCKIGDILFCTADGAAIRALALMGNSELGISLERLLQKVGLQNPLTRQYKEDFFRYHLTKGQQDRITGIGLKK